MNKDDALKKHFVRALLRDTVGEDYETVVRPAAYSFNARREDSREVNRLILLPPRGYTADTLNQMNSHDEAERATIQVKGAIRGDKNGWSKLKDCLAFVGSKDNSDVSTLNKPYMTYEVGITPDIILSKHSGGTPPFPVVKPDGFGFYHNLVNLSDDWIMLKLNKKIRPQKGVELEPHLSELPEEQAHTLRAFYNGILAYGDGVFKKYPDLIQDVEHIPTPQALPALAEMLFVHDSGKHEACSAFAMIMKFGRKDPQITTKFLKDTMDAQAVPPYYAGQLIAKINRQDDADMSVQAEPRAGS